MLKTLNIENFRGIKSLNSEAFRHVNLFFGRNNCGKSSLLEAIFWLWGMSNPRIPSVLNISRGIQKFKKENFQTLFYALNDEKKIVISGTSSDGHSRKMEAAAAFVPERRIENSEISDNTIRGNVIENSEISDNTIRGNVFPGSYDLKISFFADGTAYDPVSCSVLVGKEDSALTIHPSTNYREAQSASFIPPSRGNVSATEAAKSLFRQKRETALTGTLKKIDSRIRDLVLAGDQVLVDFGGEIRLPLSVSGDGMRKIFHLVSEILAKDGGAVIIDEIDNGLHYSAMKPLWNAVLDAAVRSGTQLFITTHNIDSLKALAKVLEERPDLREKVLTANLVRHPENDICEIIPYDFAAFELCIKQEIEMR